jgi:hypothetical protein
LVAIAVRCLIVFAVDVGGKRHVSNALDSGKEIGDRGESDSTLPKTAALYDFGYDPGFRWEVGWPAKVEFFPDPDLPPGPHEALPLIRIVRHLACQQNFDPSAEEISRSRIVRAEGLGPLSAAAAVEPGREHARIVQDEQVV